MQMADRKCKICGNSGHKKRTYKRASKYINGYIYVEFANKPKSEHRQNWTDHNQNMRSCQEKVGRRSWKLFKKIPHRLSKKNPKKLRSIPFTFTPSSLFHPHSHSRSSYFHSFTHTHTHTHSLSSPLLDKRSISSCRFHFLLNGVVALFALCVCVVCAY